MKGTLPSSTESLLPAVFLLFCRFSCFILPSPDGRIGQRRRATRAPVRAEGRGVRLRVGRSSLLPPRCPWPKALNARCSGLGAGLGLPCCPMAFRQSGLSSRRSFVHRLELIRSSYPFVLTHGGVVRCGRPIYAEI